MIDFEIMERALKIAWIKRIIEGDGSWKTILNKRLEKPTLGCLFEPLIRKRFNLFETVLSIHLNMQFQLRSVREVCKDLNIISSSLSADRVKCEPELIKGSYEQTRECIWWQMRGI